MGIHEQQRYYHSLGKVSIFMLWAQKRYHVLSKKILAMEIFDRGNNRKVNRLRDFFSSDYLHHENYSYENAGMNKSTTLLREHA